MKTARLNILQFLGMTTIVTLMVASLFTLLPVKAKAHAQAEARTIRVAANGSDTASCGADTAPCKTIQYAVNRAANGDTLLVAAGNYVYNSGNDTCTFLVTRAVVCFVDKHLTILGGYASGTWSNPNPTANPTVIDGGNSRRGVAVIAYNSTASLRMEGFTIQNGLARGTSSGTDFQISAYGGGMWSQLGSVTLRNMVFKNNRAVGGDTSTQYGGGSGGGGLALQVPSGVVSVLENVVFENNQALGGAGSKRGGAALGGGLYTFETNITGSNLTFTNNQAIAGDSAGLGIDSVYGLRADALGGGAAFSIGSNATLSNIEAQDNKALGGDAGTGSGAIAGGGFGGFLHSEQSPLSITNVIARGNQAIGGKAATGGVAFGGTLMTDATDVTIDRFSSILGAAISGASLTGGNAGAPSGGGAYITSFNGSRYTATILNSIFADNRIEVGAPGASIGGGGAGIVIQAMNATIEHSTFVRNYFVGDVKSGQAIVVHATNGDSGVTATANIRYSIIADHLQPYTTNTSALTVARGSTANLTKVMFSGNTNNTNLNGLPLPVGAITGMNTTQTVTSILFASPGNPNYDYHLSAVSPAIDQAQNSNLGVDIDGDARPTSNYPDLGADEYTQQAITVISSGLNGLIDNSVDYIRYIQVVLPDSSGTWTATSNANWLFLGGSSAHQQSGASGDYLVVYVQASQVESGLQSAAITISSANANPVSLPVNILRVTEVNTIHLPLVVH